jgi:hypothetical protein
MNNNLQKSVSKAKESKAKNDKKYRKDDRAKILAKKL